jgi:hypothetical protein
LWIWCWRWGLWTRRGEIWDRRPPARRAYASERVESLRRDGLCPSLFVGSGWVVDGVLALGVEGAPRGDLGPTASSS